MDELKLQAFPLGDLYTNSYFIFDPVEKNGLIVDAPAGVGAVREFSRAQGIDIRCVLITHGHFDHIAGLAALEYPFYLHREDAAFLTDARLNGSLFFGEPLTVVKKPQFYPDGPILFGRHTITVIPTPGHTPGSVSLKIDGCLFSGDALFYESIGRTDIPLASSQTLLISIKDRLLCLPGNTAIYPGHGKPTTVAHEKSHNPFLAGS
jgi:glyoxylase-like metal-dependent hydrolase (beta-lactamase superfamily II)